MIFSGETAMATSELIYTVKDYLAIERATDERHKYLDGQIYAMAGVPSTARSCVITRSGLHSARQSGWREMESRTAIVGDALRPGGRGVSGRPD